MNPRLLVGYLLAFAIGAACRIGGIPLPAPPALVGALVVVSMTLGYVAVDRYAEQRVATQRDNCGGSAG